jgi:hypothetical protein
MIVLSGLYSVSHPLVKFSIDICENRTTPSGKPAPLPQTIHMLGLRYTRLPFLNITLYFRLLHSIGKRKDRMYHQRKENKTLCRKSWVDLLASNHGRKSQGWWGATSPSISPYIAAFPFQPSLAYVN